MTQPVKTRRPRTEEQKAAARARYQEQHKEKCETLACDRSNLDAFAYEFLPWLLKSYKLATARGVGSVKTSDKIRYKEYGGTVFLEMSITWLREKYGRKAVEAFKKLFKLVQQGGRSKTTGESYSSIWIMNEECLGFENKLVALFNQNAEVKSSDIWNLLKDEVAYKRAPTQHVLVTGKNGRSYVMGDAGSKKGFHPEAYFKGAVADKRKELVGKAKLHNDLMDQQRARVSAEIVLELAKRKAA